MTKRVSKNCKFIFIITVGPEEKNIEQTISSIIEQDYDKRNFEVIVVGYNLTPLMNMKIAQFPIQFIKTELTYGTKAEALQIAKTNMSPLKIYDLVVLINSGDTIGAKFLEKLNIAYQSGFRYIQLHRADLERTNSIRILGTAFEEINNSIFRLGHNNIGLSSALNESGICLNYNWFKNNIEKIDKNCIVEKELEYLLLKQKILIDYIDYIHVYHEHENKTKESIKNKKINHKIQSLSRKKHIKDFFPALISGNYDLADKILQWTILPRITVVSILFFMSIFLPFVYWTLAIKWWIASLLLLFSFALASPDYIVDENWVKAFWKSPFIILGNIIPLTIFFKLRKFIYEHIRHT